MTKKINLISKNDPETGELGLIIKGLHVSNYPMVASEGLQIAHDLLEHQNGVENIGTIGDELEALAGVWFVRGQHADMSRDNRGSMYSPEENIASDICNMGVMYHNGSYFNHKVSKQTHEHDQDEYFDCILEYGRKSLLDELRCDDEPINHERVEHYLMMCKHYLRTGMRKAEKRYKGRDWAVNSLFWDIAQTVDPYTKRCDYEGQEFILTYDWERVNCEEYYLEEGYY